MPTAGSWRSGVVWALTWTVPVLAILAVLASRNETLVFTPAEQTASTAGLALVGICASACAFVGGMICARTPNIRIGGLLLGLGWVVALSLAAMAQAALDLPGSAGVPWLLGVVSIQAFPLMALLLLLFPDGHLMSSRWRPVLWLIMAIVVFSVPFSGFEPQISDPNRAESAVNWLMAEAHLLFMLIPVALLLGTVSMVLRFRRSTGVTHLQLKWLAFAAVVASIAQVAQIVTWSLASVYGPSMAALSFVVLALGFTAIPVACGVAILHHHLFDIDRLVEPIRGVLGRDRSSGDRLPVGRGHRDAFPPGADQPRCGVRHLDGGVGARADPPACTARRRPAFQPCALRRGPDRRGLRGTSFTRARGRDGAGGPAAYGR